LTIQTNQNKHSNSDHEEINHNDFQLTLKDENCLNDGVNFDVNCCQSDKVSKHNLSLSLDNYNIIVTESTNRRTFNVNKHKRKKNKIKNAFFEKKFYEQDSIGDALLYNHKFLKENQEIIEIKINLPQIDNNNKVIVNKIVNDDLYDYLFGKHKYNSNLKLFLNIEEKNIYFNKDEKIKIVTPNNFIVILNYLHDQLHPILLSLAEKFSKERRLFFNKDNETYGSVINYFLSKKEECYISVLSEILNRLNLPQSVLNDSFNYYLNFADNHDERVSIIKNSHYKLSRAGIKRLVFLFLF
jgi:hypothetical protein